MAVQPLSPATNRRLGGPLPHQLANWTRAHLSAIKSLASKTCEFNALCGISSRFRLLSPSERQIAHALLTRPPLSWRFQFRRTFLTNSVRLACVRHAASVHPEPGSNSLKNGINTTKVVLIIFQRSLTYNSFLIVNCEFRFSEYFKEISGS